MEFRYYRGISFLGVVGIIYAGILVDIFRRVTEGLIDDEHIFPQKQVDDKVLETKFRVYVGCMDLEKAYDTVMIGLRGKHYGRS